LDVDNLDGSQAIVEDDFDFLRACACNAEICKIEDYPGILTAEG